MKKYELLAKVEEKTIHNHERVWPIELFPTSYKRIPSDPAVRFFDITYIPFLSRFAYLSVIKHIASGEVVAWNLSMSLEVTLVTETVKNIQLNSYENIMIHSDQGFHYTNPAYIEIVKELKMTQSMSGKGNCIDNAPIESFFGHMKDELDYRSCQSFNELRLKIKEYMRYFNHERKQWTRNRMTPVRYRNNLLTQVGG